MDGVALVVLLNDSGARHRPRFLLQIPAYAPQNGQGHGDAVSWDLAFEISTNEKAYEDDPIPGDIGGPGFVLVPDRRVDIHYLMILASNWLMTSP